MATKVSYTVMWKVKGKWQKSLPYKSQADADRFARWVAEHRGASAKAEVVKHLTENPRNGRSYVVKGEIPKRYWEPSQGDVVYIEGTRTKLGRPYADPDTGKTMFPLRPSVRGTTDMAAGNIKAIARVEAVVNPDQVHHSIGYPTKAQAEKAKRALAKRGGGPYKVHHAGGWWYVLGPKVGNPTVGPSGGTESIESIRVHHTGDYSIWPVLSRKGTYRGRVYAIYRKGRYLTEFRTLAEAQDLVARKQGTRANPTAGPSAIPTRWTPATVSRKGGQIQIRMGRGR